MLGSAIMHVLKCHGTHFKNPAPDTVPFDLSMVRKYKYIINCVADKTANNFTASKKVNADFVRGLVAAMARDAHLIQISSDYAIDPHNVYGATKMIGEINAQSAPMSTILRVPAMYLDPTDVILTNLTVNEIDIDSTPRYHTSCIDVAKVVKRIINNKLTGIMHFSAPIARSTFQLATSMNIPVNAHPVEQAPGHMYIGNDFDIVPRTLDISRFVIPTDPSKVFMVLNLDMSDKWNIDTLIEFIHRRNIKHVICPKDYKIPPDHTVMVFDTVLEKLVPMAKTTRLLFHMADYPVDQGVFTLNDFSRLVFAMGG